MIEKEVIKTVAKSIRNNSTCSSIKRIKSYSSSITKSNCNLYNIVLAPLWNCYKLTYILLSILLQVDLLLFGSATVLIFFCSVTIWVVLPLPRWCKIKFDNDGTQIFADECSNFSFKGFLFNFNFKRVLLFYCNIQNTSNWHT
jgi:hypothetical protein